MGISALLQETIGIDDFDFHVPIITPYEWTFIANRDYIWDGSYSLDSDITMNRLKQYQNPDERKENNDHDDSNDNEPYYSLISGQYESSSSCACNNQLIKNQNTTTTIQEYKKYDANEFLKLREYHGALPNVGDDNALDIMHGAIEGKRGIASEYTT